MSEALSWRDIGTNGAFTTSQVARLLRRETSDISRWVRGPDPLIEPGYEPIAGRPVLSFDGLLEARFISHMLAEGVPMRLLRRVSRKLRAYGYSHPFACDREIVSDGFRLFESEDGRLINLVNECYAEPQLMEPALDGRIVFKRGKASYYEPYPAELPKVRIDPKVAFGRPIVVEGESAAPTSKLASVAKDEGVDAAADWFFMSPDAVRQAAEFEERIAA